MTSSRAVCLTLVQDLLRAVSVTVTDSMAVDKMMLAFAM